MESLFQARKERFREEVDLQGRLVHSILLLSDVLLQLPGSIKLDPSIRFRDEGGPWLPAQPTHPNYNHLHLRLHCVSCAS